MQPSRSWGGRGVRAVTHRAVDAEAGLGAGSAANYFSSRDALFRAIVERFAERERANFEEVGLTVIPTSPVELGCALALASTGSAGLSGGRIHDPDCPVDGPLR